MYRILDKETNTMYNSAEDFHEADDFLKIRTQDVHAVSLIRDYLIYFHKYTHYNIAHMLK